MRQAKRSWLKLMVLIAAVAGVLLTASLGRWQLGRAAQKQALAQVRAERSAMPALDASALQGLGEGQLQALLHRRIVLRGRWLDGKTIWLDNRQMQGRTGFHVLTPLQLQDSPQVLLVQRGWAPRNFIDRTALPPVQTPQGEVTVEGRLLPWPSKVYDFSQVEEGPIRQNLIFEDYRQQTGLALLAVSVQQTGADGQGLQRAWHEPGTGVEKHHGYAFQWFGLSGLIAFLYVWFQIVQPRRKKPAA